MLKKASKILRNSSNTQAVLLVWLLGLINYYYLINYSPNQKSTCSIMCFPGSTDRKESACKAGVKVKVKLLSHVWPFATLWTVACQDPPSMEFSRREYRSGLPFPSPGDLPDSGIELRSPALQGLFTGWATRQSWVQSLGQEDPLEKGMATHSSILVWKIPGAEKPGGLQSMELQTVEHNWETNTFTFTLGLIIII